MQSIHWHPRGEMRETVSSVHPRPDDICRQCRGKGHWRWKCQSQGNPQKEKPEVAEAVESPSAAIRMAHVKSCPGTGSHASGDINGWKITVLLDSGSEISLTDRHPPVLKTKKMRHAGLKLVIVNHQPLQTEKSPALTELGVSAD